MISWQFFVGLFSGCFLFMALQVYKALAQSCKHALVLNQVDYISDYHRDQWTTVHSYCRLCGEAGKSDLKGTIPAVNACLRSNVLYIDPIYTITGDKPYRDSTKILDARASDGLGLHQSVAPMNYNELTRSTK